MNTPATPAAALAPNVPMPPAKPECKPTALQVAYDRRHHFLHIVPAGLALADVLEPTYWRNVYRDIARSKWPLIEAVCDDGSWEAMLRVYAVGDGFAKCRVILEWHADKKARKPAPEGYRIEQLPGQGWRALSPSGDIVAANKGVEDEAIEAAIVHARKAKKDAA